MFKSVLITGGAQRIGKSIAKYLGGLGYNIAIQYYKSHESAKELAKHFKALDVKFSSYKFDFEGKKDINLFYKDILKDFGEIDILINNASTFEFDTLMSSDEKKFDKHINVNLKAPFFLSKSFVGGLKKKRGIIINILDQRVKNITPYFTSYTISKTALYSLTKSLSISLAPNIRVNGISPGPTLMSKNQNKNQFRKQVLRTPLKTQVKLSEINAGVSYLLDNQSITGEVLTLDSGQSLGWAHSKSKIFKTD
ncbi:MAG: SDR family NAD(P)-dependent oxidoreductase [Alphaproteobacteria bacterium]|tara:strand:+ start:1556 stop:2311 length:756 start_codon:yes stop_codon:yes gene_type:complete